MIRSNGLEQWNTWPEMIAAQGFSCSDMSLYFVPYQSYSTHFLSIYYFVMTTAKEEYAMKKHNASTSKIQIPMLTTAKEMSIHCGIGENTLRKLMENRGIEFLQIGNRRLLCEDAIWDYYRRHKTPVKSPASAMPEASSA
mgnify:FL=1